MRPSRDYARGGAKAERHRESTGSRPRHDLAGEETQAQETTAIQGRRRAAESERQARLVEVLRHGGREREGAQGIPHRTTGTTSLAGRDSGAHHARKAI